MAIDGDTAVVGAYGDEGSASETGSAYVFERSGDIWTQKQKLVPGDSSIFSYRFGYSVDIDGDWLVVGAYRDSFDRGSAYIFQRSGGTWSEHQKLTASDGAGSDEFGKAVSISGNKVAIAARRDDNTGSAYIFVESGGTWSEEQRITASDADTSGFFGESIAIAGDTVVVGAVGDDELGSLAGAAYVFTRSGGVWTEQQKLTASDGGLNHTFGRSVSISGDTLIVGSDGDDDLGGFSGSAYVFTRSGGVWTQQQKLTAADGAGNDLFGEAVAVDGDTAIVGAFQDGDLGNSSGSAYVFTRTGSTWTQKTKLNASDGATDDDFGRANIDMNGGSAILGAFQNDDLGSSSGSAYVFVTPLADLVVTKTDSADPVGIGASFAYTITVTNNGPSTSTNVLVTDTLPAEVSFVTSTPGSPTCTESGGTVTCNLNSLAPDASTTIDIFVVASSGGQVENRVDVSSDQSDPVPATSSTTEATIIPTVSQWGLLILAGMIIAAFVWRRRSSAKRP